MAEHKAKVYVAVIGVGGVGKEVLSQILSIRPQHPRLTLALITTTRNTLVLVRPGTASIAAPAPGSLDELLTSLSSSTNPVLQPNEIVNYLASLDGPGILIDNTAGTAVVDVYETALRKGLHVVTPNKKGFAAPLPISSAIYAASYPSNPSGGLLYHEAAVCAGLPIISTLKDLIGTGDKVRLIQGVFSGTMSFLFNEFDPNPDLGDGEGVGFSEVVRQARAAGFTEPDPRDDLDGGDVARKLTILGRMVGLKVESIESFPVQSLIPSELAGKGKELSADGFLDALKDFDGRMGDIKEKANKAGKVVRYVGTVDVEKGGLEVGLKEFERGDAIAGLKGSDNVVSFTTERYAKQPLVVQGAGAGGAVTAMGVTSDLIRVLERIK